MANDPLTQNHPDETDDVLDVAQPGTSDTAKSGMTKKDTTYKENTTSPDELISLDELYTTTGQETLEIIIDGYHELKNHQRLSRAQGDAAKLDTDRWVEFADKSNGLRYGDMFINQLRQSSAQTFTNGERFTRVLLKRSQERSLTVSRLISRLGEKIIAPVLSDIQEPFPVTEATAPVKLTLFIRQDEGIEQSIARLTNTLLGYSLCHQQLTEWANQLEGALTDVRQASDRPELFRALRTLIQYDDIPKGVAHLCRVFCGEFPEDANLSVRQLYTATEKNLQFKDVVLTESNSRLTTSIDNILKHWFNKDSDVPIEKTSRRLANLAQQLMDSFVPPVDPKDNELLFTFMEAQRTCTRLSMILDMTQGLLQSLCVVLFTAVRCRIEALKTPKATAEVDNAP